MLLIACPRCGEEDRIAGTPDEAGVIRMSCEACGAAWERDVRLRCRLCGSENLLYTPRPLWEKGRGDQHTPAGRFDAYACGDCGGRDVTSGRPLPG